MLALNMLPILSLQRSITVVVTCGLITHIVYKRHEVPPSRVLTTFVLLVASPIFSSAFLYRHFSAGVAFCVGLSVFYVTLLSSIAVYRVSPWHPLAKYPGPLIAKLTQFWLVRATMTGKYHVTLKGLHDKYGPYIRVGPNEVSFVDADLIPKIMGPDGMPKGPMFDGMRMPGMPTNVVTTRDLADHAQKRKPWSQALSAAATRDYTQTIVRRALQLAEELGKLAEEGRGKGEASIDLSSWLSRFAFDFMGDMAFGGGFELMKEGDSTGIWTMINGQVKTMAMLQHIPWSIHLVHKLPAAVEAMAKFNKFCIDCIARRRENPRGMDLFYHLVNEEAGTDAFPPHDLVIENSKLVIVAGSDTTASVLGGLFFHLLSNLDALARLRTELEEAFPPEEGNTLDFTKLAELPFLNAVINETLRLQPPVPTGLQRAPAVGAGSRRVGHHVISEGTAVNLPPYVYHRDPRYFFPKPDEFWPDRWLRNTTSASEKGASEVINNVAAFIPFSHGPANCAGKMLALTEIRCVTALLLQRFEMRFAEGYDVRRWNEDMEDSFVLTVGPLPVVLSVRPNL
ncbi:hypothetical protein M0805_000390 [Coniferiporia weirii]|nr:hypothetical protein M0805_000390 [Coniferiporia weirii]